MLDAACRVHLILNGRVNPGRNVDWQNDTSALTKGHPSPGQSGTGQVDSSSFFDLCFSRYALKFVSSFHTEGGLADADEGKP